MIKKALLGVGLLALGGFILYGTQGFGYLRTALKEGQEFAEGQVPIEFKIKDVKRQVEELGPMVRELDTVIAKEVVAIRRLQESIQVAKNEVGDLKGKIVSLNTEWSSGAVAERDMDSLKRKLDSALKSYEIKSTTLASQEKMLDARQHSLEAATRKQEEVRNLKEQLLAKVAELESRQKMVEAQKATTKFVFDDSEFSRIQKRINEIDDSIAVEEIVTEKELGSPTETGSSSVSDSDLNERLKKVLGEETGKPAGTSL